LNSYCPFFIIDSIKIWILNGLAIDNGIRWRIIFYYQIDIFYKSLSFLLFWRVQCSVSASSATRHKNKPNLLIHLETKSISVRGTGTHFVTNRPIFLESFVEFVVRLSNLLNSPVLKIIIFVEKRLRFQKRLLFYSLLRVKKVQRKKYGITKHC